jgi:hypothetical protein
VDKAALVDHDLRIGSHVISLLAANGIPVQDAFWVYLPQVEEWRLILSSPFVNQKGTRQTYVALSNILNKSPLISEIPVRRISVLSPSDPALQRIRSGLGLDEAFIYEGSLHVFQSRRKDGTSLYHVTFAPYSGPGGAIPVLNFAGEDELSDFLINKVGIRRHDVVRAQEELRLRGTSNFPMVHLRTGDLRRFGLLPPAKTLRQEQHR